MEFMVIIGLNKSFSSSHLSVQYPVFCGLVYFGLLQTNLHMAIREAKQIIKSKAKGKVLMGFNMSCCIIIYVRFWLWHAFVLLLLTTNFAFAQSIIKNLPAFDGDLPFKLETG